MCSIPSREYALEQTVASLMPQLPTGGRMYVFLNGYKAVPEFLQDKRITVARSQDHGDRGDTNKFFFVSPEGGAIRGRVLLCDDDIIYPPTHVARILEALERWKDRVVVSFHGERMRSCADVIERSLEHHRGIREVIMGLGNVPTDQWVHAVGTGSSGFHTDAIAGFTRDCCPFPHMSDIWFAAFCQHHKVPMLVIAHSKDDLVAIEGTQEKGKAIWCANCHDEDSARNTYVAQVAVILQLQPWVLWSIDSAGKLRGVPNGPRAKWLYRRCISNPNGTCAVRREPRPSPFGAPVFKATRNAALVR